MKITIVGPGIMPIPPTGWGAVEILIWDLKNAYEELGHQVQIVNTQNLNEIIDQIKDFDPDFVHFEYDDMIVAYPFIQYPKAITTHFAYLQTPEKIGSYVNVLNHFKTYSPNVFCLSQEIVNVYNSLVSIPEENLYLTPNGVNSSNFTYKTTPEYPDRSIYLAKIDYRKRQHLFQSIFFILCWKYCQ